MLRAASRAVLIVTFLVFAALGLSAAENEESEAAAKAAEAFESLYGKEYKQVKATAEAADDIDLAKRLLAVSGEARGQPAFLTILCEKACELAGASAAGYATAAQALEILAFGVPEKAPACAARLLEIRQKQFDASRGSDRAKAGEALIDALLPMVDAKEKEGAATEAAALLKRAVFVAAAVKSGRRGDLDARLKAMEQSLRTAREIDDLKKQIEADPKKAAARERLVKIHLVDLDDPAEAAKWVEGVEDESLRKYVPAAARPLAEAPELACLELGEWYRGLGEEAPPPAKAAMYARAKAYYDRFLEMHAAADLDRTKARAALLKIEAEIGKSPHPTTTPAKETEAPAKEGKWIDALALVDPAKDAVRGDWQRKGAALVIESQPGQENQIKVPVIPQGNYEFQFKFTRSDPSGAYMVSVIIPVGESGVMLDLGAGGADPEAHLLESIKGKGIDGNETLLRPATLEDGVAYSVSVKVETDRTGAGISVVLDGRPIITWRGPPGDLSVHPAWRLPDHRGPALMAKSCSVVWHSVRLRMLSGEARFLRAGDKPTPSEKPAAVAKPAPKEKPGKWIDVLALVDPAKDAARGDWRSDNGALQVECSFGQSALIAIPVMPQGDYELDAKFVRTKDLPWSMTSLVLPVGSTSVDLNLGARWENNPLGHGLEAIDGKAWDNETVVKSGRLETGVEHTVSVKVHAGESDARVTVVLDGESIIDWHGPPSALSVGPGWALPRTGCLGLIVKSSAAVWRSVRLRMITGEAKPARPLTKPAKP